MARGAVTRAGLALPVHRERCVRRQCPCRDNLRTDASRAAFIEYCYHEALAIIEENKAMVFALAQTLIDHHERTLNAAEIDAVIAQTLAREALAAEQARRVAWQQVTERVAETTS